MTAFASHVNTTHVNHAQAPLNMVLGQLITNTVLDPRILNAMLAIERGMFLPENLAHSAYVDEAMPLGNGRYLLSPLTLAKLLDLAAIKPTDRVLEIGCATGYATAVLGKLCAKVIGIEADEELARQATRNLAAHHIDNANIIHVSSLLEGYWLPNPYDVIFINGSVEEIPQAIAAQLLQHKGRMITVKRLSKRPDSRAGLGRAIMIMREGSICSERTFFDCSATLLGGFEVKKSFTL